MATAEEGKNQQVLRVTDIAEEPLEILLPIDGYEEMPLVSLEEAVEKLVHIMPRIQTYAHVAKERCKKPADNLTQDESASIMLYTMDWQPFDKCLYVVLNRTLRSKDRHQLKPWFLYLRLLFNGFFRLPSISRTVFRGIKLNLIDQYVKDEKIVWWGFSSCTVAMSVLQSEQFLGKAGVRTMFTIECLNGKDIRKHSYYSSESEILLLPATQFQIIDSLDQGDLKLIHLQEIVPKFPLLQPILSPLQKIDTTNKKKTSIVKEKVWLQIQFHDNEKQGIIRPHEVQLTQKDYPPSINDDYILDRIQGSMLGLAIGDALGAPIESRSRQYVLKNPITDFQEGGTWGLAKGQFTDDTSMALCLANSLIACQDFVPYNQLVRYKWWYRFGYMSSTGSCFAIGDSTRQSIEEFERRQKVVAKTFKISLDDIDHVCDYDLLQKIDVYCSAAGVAGNGALMRLAPIPLFFYKDPLKAVEYSGISGQITHGDERVYDACRYYGALIVATLNGETKENLLDKNFYAKHRSWFGSKNLHPDIMTIAQGSYMRVHGYDGGIRGKGYIVNALEAALWAFWYDQSSFQMGVLNAINLGDDSGATAAIYGQLAGAYYGYEHLPKKWCIKIYAKEFILCVAKWIAYEGDNWFKRQIS